MAAVPGLLEAAAKTRMQTTLELGASVSFSDFTAGFDRGFQMDNGCRLPAHYAQIKVSFRRNSSTFTQKILTDMKGGASDC